MKFPIARARVGRRFEPALRSENVGTAIAVHVARTDTVAVTARADGVAHKGAVLQLIPGERGILLTELWQQFVPLAVIIDIDHEDEFHRPAILDSMLFPFANPAARILHPVKFLRKVR